MSAAPKPYVIQPGDTLLTIALWHEVEPERIWEHEKNAELKSRRDPEILAPGEVLYIPPPEPPTLQVSPQATNRFRARVPKVQVHLAFAAETGPLASEPYVVLGLAEPLEGRLDDAGEVTLEVPATTRRLTLTFPERDIEHDIAIGHLDPVDRPSGLRARLLHRSFLPIGQDSPDPYVFPTRESLETTLRAFQRAYGLEPTGMLDPQTAKALTDAHGS